jgi:hypothetical protein
LERSDNPGETTDNLVRTLKGLFPHMPNPFRVIILFYFRFPGLSLRSNHWAKISQRLRRIYIKFKIALLRMQQI